MLEGSPKAEGVVLVAAGRRNGEEVEVEVEVVAVEVVEMEMEMEEAAVKRR